MSLIKKCFVSRWGEHGSIVEVDFSQLEVVGVAFLSGDPMLMRDILDGKDLHCMSASFLWGVPYEEVFHKAKVEKLPEWIKKRSSAKSPTFQLQYGAGYKSIAKKCGLTEAQAKTFVDNYYGRYKVLQQWQEANIEAVEASRVPSGKHSPNGIPLGIGHLESVTGRKYAFTEGEAFDWLQAKGILSSFNPPQIKNYPSQGFATGDVVPMCLGELYLELKKDELLRHSALLINTVHDSVILDVKDEVLEPAVELVESVLTSAPKLLKMYFDLDFTLPIQVETSWGKTWGDA